MKYASLLAVLAMLILPVANAITVEWSPQKPKKGEVVTVYATLNANQSQHVKLEYCIKDACFFQDMHYENGKWVGNFTMPNAKVVEVKILVDGNIVWHTNITAAEKHTPSFEVSFVIFAMFIAIVMARRRWS